jgi:hypothetical protein
MGQISDRAWLIARVKVWAFRKRTGTSDIMALGCVSVILAVMGCSAVATHGVFTVLAILLAWALCGYMIVGREKDRHGSD